MIEAMPNILKDQGVKEDIRIKVEMLMNEACGHLAITEEMENRVRRAAEWAMSEGFRTGWKLGQNAAVKEMRNYELLNKQVKKGDKQ